MISKNDYPFISCLDPQYVYNKYTRETLEVPCNKCVACKLSKGVHWSTLCDIQEQDSKFTMFVTLTYSNITIPTCTPYIFDVGTPDQKIYFKLNEPERWSEDSRYISDNGFLLSDDTLSLLHVEKMDKDYNFMCSLVDKFNMNGDIPLMCKYDAQKFFKRFRYYCNKLGIYEKIKYYCVGELGPEHFRPHIHALIYFDSGILFRKFKEILSASWKFGRVDFSRSRGKCSSYLSKYLNSSSSVPEFFTFKVTKAFCIHSTHFATSFYENETLKRNIYKDDPRGIIDHVRQVGQRDELVSMWRNLTFIFFPKVRRFNDADYYTLFRLYTAYPMACQIFGQSSLSKLVDNISASAYDYFTPVLYDQLGCHASLRKYEQIYHDLYVSKHFFNFCCSNDWNNTCTYIRKIIDFHKYFGLKKLKDFYEFQVLHPEIDYHYFYDNFKDTYDRKNLLVFKNFRTAVAFRQQLSIKHKIQNDKNKMFVDYE